MSVDRVDAATMSEMRAWALSRTWEDAEANGESSAEFVDALTDEEVLVAVDIGYAGSVEQFVRDASGDVVDSVP